MTTYTGQRATTLLELPERTDINSVLYYVDGTIKDGLTIITHATDHEGIPATTTTTQPGLGIEWDIPIASDLEYGSWSKDETYKSHPSSAHGILITQQVLSFAGINEVYAADIEGRRLQGEYYWTGTAQNFAPKTFINGKELPANQRIEGRVIPFPLDNNYSDLTQWVKDKIVEFKEPFKNSVRLHVYKDGGFSDPVAKANDGGRTTALFTECAYATGIYWLNREDPQFQGGAAPDTQYYVEGMRIHKLTESSGGYTLSDAKEYSNNPAWVLMDYLRSPIYGKNLSLDDLDLKSFYDAAVICDQVVVEGVPREGAFWQGRVGTRDVRLYECNIILDSSKPLRENITAILATMNDANLLWSGGKYKLILAYPNVWGVTGSRTVG